jgi:nucleotide-binding universal stress UspA family protein
VQQGGQRGDVHEAPPESVCPQPRTHRAARQAVDYDRVVFRSILVAIDGSENAARALSEAAELTQLAGAQLTVMTSAPDMSAWVMNAPGVDLEALARNAAREYAALLDRAVETMPAGVRAEKVLANGPAAEAVLQQIKDGGHDLVVVGSRGLGEVRSLLLGSVSHRVLQSSPIPGPRRSGRAPGDGLTQGALLPEDPAVASLLPGGGAVGRRERLA